MKARAGSLKRNKIDKPLTRLIKKKIERIQIKSEMKVTTDTTVIQRILRNIQTNWKSGRNG